MRNFILEEAHSRDSTFLFPKLRRLIRTWLARRTLRKLEQFDDYMLADIGLSRDDLRYGLSLPLDIDPIAELARQREHRSPRGQRRK